MIEFNFDFQESELRAELGERWKMKYEQDLASAKEKYAKEMTDLKEERDHLLELKVQQEQAS